MTAERPVVLLVGDTLDLGGTEGQFVEVLCGLDRARFDVRACCMRPEGPLKKRLDEADVSVFRASRGSLRPVPFLRALPPLVGYLRANDVRIVHSFGFYGNVLAMPAARFSPRTTAIASQRDLGDVRSLPRRAAQSVALRLADHILVNSPAVREALGRSSASLAERAVVVPNGVDLARFHPPEARAAANGAMIFSTLANLRPEKGLSDLLEAAAIVARSRPDCRFRVWGDGELRDSLAEQAHRLELDGAFQLCGATCSPEAALRESDVFVLPSHSEASSNAVLEAMATGLPVIATRVGGTPFLVEHGSTGLLVPPRDPALLAAALLELVADPEKARRLGEEGLRRVRERFSTERMVRDVAALYEETLRERSERR